MGENKNKSNEEDVARRIQSLRDAINSAEKAIQASKAMLLQLEGKQKPGRKRKAEEIEGGQIIEGTFDGQIMLGTDGKQYPVPANYASKSKLVEGDLLKLTITSDGSFIYKQIGPVERKRLIGVVSQDEKGNYYVMAEGKPYQVLLASVTYFGAEPGDEVTLIVPRDLESNWGAIENIIKKGSFEMPRSTRKSSKKAGADTKGSATAAADSNDPVDELIQQQSGVKSNPPGESQNVIDEWVPDLEELKKELQKNQPPEQ